MNNNCSGEVPVGNYVSPNNRSSNAIQCNCVPDCEEVKYHIQAVQRNREKSRDGVFGFDNSVKTYVHRVLKKFSIFEQFCPLIGL